MADQMTIPEFHAALKSQGVSSHEHFAFICPACGTVQSGRDLMKATGKPFAEIERHLGFSCIGRFTGAGPVEKKRGGQRGCDWTLGGLLRIHSLEVVDGDERYPRFALATAEQAQAHEATP